MITFDAQPYVFVSLADGPIVYYLLDIERGLLYERKKVPLGTKPTTLTICHQTDSSSILFACSDHPTVISSSNNKLVFSSVNLREIVCMCSFNSKYYGSSLTLVTDMGVILGRIDDIQKLHVRSLSLGESVRRIDFNPEEKIYIILTQYMDIYQTENLTPISKQAHQKLDCITKIKSIEELTHQESNDVFNSIVILDQHTHEGQESNNN
jgi:DNA damage-binding protein 1